MSDAAPAAPVAAADDAHLREHRVSSETVFKGRLLEVRRDHITLPTGDPATREYIVHPGAVAVVPILDDGRVVMERQFRYPVGRVMLEFPAGKLDPGEGTFGTAIRELEEETGYRAAEWARACVLHNAVAYSDEFIEIWFARGLSQGVQQLDHGEHLDVVILSVDEVEAMAACGEITDAKTLIALMWWQKWLSGAWPLRWQPAPPR